MKWFLVLVGLVSALAVPAAASASPVTNPSAELRQGTNVVTHLIAGSNGGVAIFLNPTVALGGGDTVTVTGPEGSDFSGLLGVGHNNTMTNMTTLPGSSSNIPDPDFSDGGRTVTAEVPGNIGVAAGQQLKVSLSGYQNLITFGTVSGPSSFQVSTNKDTTPVATSPSYTTDPGDPTSVIAVDGSQRTPFNQLFDPMKVEVDDQYGNPVPNQGVTAIAPVTSGASGTFEDGTANATVTTGTDGQATLPRITANDQTGDWDLDLQGPGSTSGSYEMHNLAYGDPSVVNLALAPSSVPADGSSTIAATATVTDQYGNPVPGEQVGFTTDGVQQIGSPVDNGDGTYTATITASTKAGASKITATDGDGDDVTPGSATLTQTALPAKTIALTLSPTTFPADGKSTTTAKAVVQDALGNAVTDAPVTMASNGGQKFGAVKNSGQGVYTATVTASKAVGSSQITAAVTGSSPLVSAGQTLTQTAIPIPPKVVKPKLRFVHPPKKRVRSAKVKFRFKVVKGKARGFQCKLDKKKWSKCKSPKKVRLKKGKHVFKVRGIATNGKFGEPIVRRIKRLR